MVLVNDVKVRRNQPQCSNFAFKVRSSQSHSGSYRSQRGRCQATGGNLYCIFCLKNDMYSKNESERGNGVELSAKKICAESSTQWPSAQYFRSNLQRNYQFLR